MRSRAEITEPAPLARRAAAALIDTAVMLLGFVAVIGGVVTVAIKRADYATRAVPGSASCRPLIDRLSGVVTVTAS